MVKCNFVFLQEVENKMMVDGTVEKEQEVKRGHVLAELLETERLYVSELGAIVEVTSFTCIDLKLVIVVFGVMHVHVKIDCVYAHVSVNMTDSISVIITYDGGRTYKTASEEYRNGKKISCNVRKARESTKYWKGIVEHHKNQSDNRAIKISIRARLIEP